MNNKYIILIDGLGIGKATDSRSLKSEGANTLKLLNSTQRLKITNLKHLGIGLIKNADGLGYELFPIGIYGKAYSQIKTKNRYSLMQELLQVDFNNIPSFNPVGCLPAEFLKRVEKNTGESFIVNKTIDFPLAIKTFNATHAKTKKNLLFTTGKSDLILAGNTDIIPESKIVNVFNSVVSQVKSMDKFKFAEYHLMTYHKSPVSDKFVLNKKISKHIYSPCLVEIDNAVFVGSEFKKVVISKSIINTKNDLETYQYISNEMRKTQTANTTYIINFNQMYHRLILKDIEGALNAINLIDLYIGEILKSVDDTDELLIIGTCGCDSSVLPRSPSKEAVPFIFFTPNCVSKNFGTLNLSEVLTKKLNT